MSEKHFSGRMFAALDTFTRAANHLQSPLLLLVRLYWGWQFAQTGWGKLHNLPRVAQFFASLGIPAPGVTAHFIAGLEFFGGLLLILGLASRFTGLLLAGDMFVAYLAADRQALHSVFSDPGKFYNADPYTFLFASVLVFVFGPGRFAIDAMLARQRRRDTAVSAAPNFGASRGAPAV
jgi:putative oxidoreductase